MGPDWLFDYTSLFKSINVSSSGSSGSVSGLKKISEDQDEEVVYRSPSESSSSFTEKSPVSSEGEPSATPEGESAATPQGESSMQHDIPKSSDQIHSPDVETTPHISIEK